MSASVHRVAEVLIGGGAVETVHAGVLRLSLRLADLSVLTVSGRAAVFRRARFSGVLVAGAAAAVAIGLVLL